MTIMHDIVNNTSTNITTTTTLATTSAIIPVATFEQQFYHYEVPANIQILCYSIVFIISVISDTLIFLVIGFDKKLHTKTNFLLLCLALADWLTVVVGIPVNIVNLKAENSVTEGLLCKVTGMMVLVMFLMSNFHLALIAVHRYVLIVKHFQYKVWFTRRNIALILLFCWLLTISLALTPFFGWGNYSYNVDRAHCMIKWGYSESFLVFLEVSAFLIPLSIMTFCYYKVVHHTRASQKRLQTSADRHNLGKTDRELRLTLMLILVLLVFVTLETPYAILICWEGFGHTNLPQAYGFVALLMVYSNSTFDFWIYACTSKKFRRSCFKLLIRCCCVRNERTRIHPTSVNHPIPSDNTTDSSTEQPSKMIIQTNPQR